MGDEAPEITDARLGRALLVIAILLALTLNERGSCWRIPGRGIAWSEVYSNRVTLAALLKNRLQGGARAKVGRALGGYCNNIGERQWDQSRVMAVGR